MRQVHHIIVLLLCLAAIRAEQEQQQQKIQKLQPPPLSQRQPPQQVLDIPRQLNPSTSPNISPEDLNEARTELYKILSEMPIQTVEPLVETPRAYCRAFTALCNIACEERLEATGQPTTDEGNRSPEIASAECANPDANTVFHARAKCECVGLDMTDRVNFALVGGVTSSRATSTSDFSADGLLDGLTSLPAIATFVNIIHIAQKVCYYVGFLKVLADDTSNPLPPTPTGGGSIFDGIKGWFPGLFGGGPKPTPTQSPLFGGLPTLPPLF
ncbi:hypothetical protein BGZ82_001377, partial [Podila clonocystis]